MGFALENALHIWYDKTNREADMESKRHQKLYEHYTNYFGQEPSFSLKLKKNVLPEGMKPITTHVFEPSDEMPFWKLCTIGASDFLMPEREIGWGRKANRRNEYIMLISPDVNVCPVSDDDIENPSNADWLYLNSLLWSTAQYPFVENDNITVSDTIDMGLKGKYCGTVLLLPEVFKSPKIVKCYISEHKYISIFQVMPITRELLSKKLKKGTNGIYWLMEYFYTHDDDYHLTASKPLTTL